LLGLKIGTVPELRFKTMLKKLQNGESGMAADILEEVYA